ncbi:MAG: tRNA lysidine(34) synthetase TilS, partial [Terriglobales bacterium]
ALLCLLLELRSELGIVLSVAHVNHKLRGEESEEDERFVAKVAQQCGLELRVCAAPLIDQSNSKISSGIEATARRLRYDFFRCLAREGRVGKIATAHTLDDQAETVLLRIFRGTGIRGLSGIHPRVVFQEEGRVFGELLRPLLGFRRAALQEFLRECNQTWREDSSNQEMAFLRNRVRHRLLPLIGREFGEAAIEHMAELAEIARAEDEHWESGHPGIAGSSFPGALFSGEKTTDRVGLTGCEQVTDSVGLESGYRFSDTASCAKSDAPLGAELRPETPHSVRLSLTTLLALPLAAQRRLMRAWVEANAADLAVSFRLIEEALELARGTTGRKLELPGGRNCRRRNLRRGRQELVLESEAGSAQDHERQHPQGYEYTLTVPGVIEVPELGATIEARMVDANEVPEQERGQLLDVERLPGKLLIRNWRPGDRYWPAHTAAAKKVKELLSDRHLTGAQKKLWPVAVAECQGLVWMRGFAVPAAFRAPAEAAQAIWIRETAGMM